MAVIGAHLSMLPRLNAEERIDAYLSVAVGSGTLAADASKTIRRDLDAAAAGTVRRRAWPRRARKGAPRG